MTERLWTRDLLRLPEDSVSDGTFEIKNGRVVILDEGFKFSDCEDYGAIHGTSVHDRGTGIAWVYPQRTGIDLFFTRVAWGVTERLLNMLNIVDVYLKVANQPEKEK